MSDKPMLDKMDALMKKHRGGGESEQAPASGTPAAAAPSVQTPPPDAWLPVLTQVIERGVPPATPAAAPAPDRIPTAAAAPAPTATPALTPAPDAGLSAEAAAPLTEQLLSELAPRLSEAMEKIVRDAVAEKLKQTRDPSS
jgi:hypothetical protein